jgi:hypothetical protein
MASRGARPALTPARIADHPRVASSVNQGSGFQRNAANPTTGSGMQQARKPSRGENRRGGAKPRGRNEAGRVVPSARWEHTGNRSAFLEVDAQRSCRWRGSQVTNPRRGRAHGARSDASASGRLRREGPAAVRTLHRRCTRGGNLEGAGNGQGVPTTDGSPSRSDAPVLSSRAPDRQRSKAAEGAGKNPPTCSPRPPRLVRGARRASRRHRRWHRSAPLRRPRRPSHSQKPP